MTDRVAAEAAVMERLLKAAPAADLGEDEIALLREALNVYRVLRTLGVAARFVVVVLAAVAAAMAAWETIAGKVRAWLGGS